MALGHDTTATPDMFFYGTLCHPPLLRAVLGRDVAMVPAHLPGFHVACAQGRPHPVLIERADAVARGVLVRDLTPDDVARLNFYEDGFAFATLTLPVQTGIGPCIAQLYLSPPGQWQPVGGWNLADWQAGPGDMVTATAADVMALYGQAPAARVLGRYTEMLVRGAGRVRARSTAPTTLRRTTVPGDVAVDDHRQPYADFFAVEEFHVRFRRFDGALGPRIKRAVFVTADAVTVLPYDPLRDRVLLIEQFRMGPYARGDDQPWLLEPIAGRIDPGETPDQAARREASEESGLTLGPLIQIARHYPSPGVNTEFLYSYVAICDLPDGAAGVFGSQAEAEDIRGHLMDFDTMMALVETGEIATAPLLLSALWLQRERPRLCG